MTFNTIRSSIFSKPFQVCVFDPTHGGFVVCVSFLLIRLDVIELGGVHLGL